MRLTNKERVNIIRAYNELTPMITLAKQYGVTRQAIWKLLRKYEQDTSKHRILVSCTVCGKEILRTKARIRKQLHHFCSTKCYYAYLEAGNGHPYIQNRNGQRIGRSIVSKYFNLAAEHIVHHEDRNTLNNKPRNLKAFRNQGDHVRYHRGFDVEPIWNGLDIDPPILS